MTPEMIQTLTVAGLLAVAGVLWSTVKKVIELGVVVKVTDTRVTRLEDKVNQ